VLPQGAAAAFQPNFQWIATRRPKSRERFCSLTEPIRVWYFGPILHRSIRIRLACVAFLHVQKETALLVGGAMFAQHRVRFLLGAVFGFCLLTTAWYAAIRTGWLPRPSGSSPVGYACGLIAFGIIVFEMLLWPRKLFRRFQLRWLGSTRLWLFLHVWLGLVSLPLVFGHSGFIYGRLFANSVATQAGSLSALVMTLYLLVIASGIWGLLMQQIVPQKLLDEIPGETIATERDRMSEQFLEEAKALMASLLSGEATEEEERATTTPATRVAPYRASQLAGFFDRQIIPYLERGRAGRGPLAAPARAQQLFAELRRDAGPELAQTVDRLEAVCTCRRQLDRQYDLQWWLHSWLCLHLPLSIALFALLLLHIVYALKYW
jgi:hypothetical protein